MKKLNTILIGIVWLSGIMLSSLPQKSWAQEFDTEVVDQCEGEGSQSCCVQYTAAIDAVEADWKDNLQLLINQEKPASEMVDDAYENLRTYSCWLDYICRSVQYSGYGPMESGVETGLTSVHLGIAPGCQKPEKLKMESHYNDFVQKLEKVPLLSPALSIPDNFYKTNRINYFPGCMTDPSGNNERPLLTEANANFEACKQNIDLKFGCNAEDIINDPEAFSKCMNESSAIAIINSGLNKSHADQKARALEQKLGSIITNLHVMQTHVVYLSNFWSQLNQRLYCVAKQCT